MPAPRRFSCASGLRSLHRRVVDSLRARRTRNRAQHSNRTQSLNRNRSRGLNLNRKVDPTLHLTPIHNPNPLHLISAGITLPDRNYRIRRESSNLTVLEYIVSGKGHLRVEDRRYPIQAGDVYLLHPGSNHDYHADWDDPWEKIWFNLSGTLIGHLIEAYHLKDAVHFPNCPLEQEFRDALAIVQKRPTSAYTELALALHRIFARIHEWRQQHPEMRKSPEGLKLKEYLDLHWREPVSLEDLAEQIGRSRSQVVRIFRRDWEISPLQYLQQQRLNLARQYLENTDCKISMIAEITGFRDEFYFSNWFKEKTGVSPLFYKKGKR